MASITYDKATRRYPGSERPAVDALDLEIADGEFLVLVGPSGCGKTTSLRMLAGLEQVDAGSIHIGERDVTDPRSFVPESALHVRPPHLAEWLANARHDAPRSRSRGRHSTSSGRHDPQRQEVGDRRYRPEPDHLRS